MTKVSKNNKHESEKQIAKLLFDKYSQKFSQEPDEMTMHKLMYFLQRESFLQNSKPLFDEDFYGWKFGPVLKSIRTEYKGHPNAPYSNTNVSGDIKKSSSNLIDFILNKYGVLTAWKLSALSHGEVSWKQSRFGLDYNENGDHRMSKSAINVDALLEKGRRQKNKKYEY